jgi:hypothetical protein
MAKKQSNNKPKKTKDSFLSKITKKQLLSIVLVAFAGIGGYFVFASQAATKVVNNAPNPPAVYISPQSQTIGAGETFTIEIRENSGTTAVNAVQANLIYPTNLIDYIPTTAEVTASNPNGISFVGSAFGIEAESRLDTSTGQIKIARGSTGGTSITGDKLIAKLTFKAKTVGGLVPINLDSGTALISSSTNANILPAGGGLVNATYTIDTVGPTTSVTAPANGTNIELGSTTSITATASDSASSVTKVEFYIDGVLPTGGTDTSSPYSYSWNTAGVAEGSHNISVKAYDTFNNITTTPNTTVNVKDNTAPTVSLTAPVASVILAGNVTVSANASDNTGGKGVNKVEFYAGTTLIGTDTTSPYSVNWNTTSVADGSYAITAKAFDNSTVANTKTSTVVSVTVDNSDKTPPTAPGNLRTTATDYTTITLAWNASTDNVGVTGYRLSRNGTQIYSGTALSFNDTGLAEGTSYNYSVVALDAKGNISPATNLTAITVARTPGDLNKDNIVNVFDLSILLTNWNTTNTGSDLNKDNIVNVFDLSILLTNWTL